MTRPIDRPGPECIRSFSYRLFLSGLVVAALAGQGILPAYGDDWSSVSSLTERVEYNDNKSLQSTSPGHVWGLLTTISTELVRESPTLDASLRAEIQIDEWTGPGEQPGDDAFDQDYGINVLRKTKTANYGLTGSYTIQSTSTSELDDSGDRTVDAERLTGNVTGTALFNVNRNNTANLSASFEDVDFTGDSDSFTPSQNYEVSGGWTHSITASTAADLNVSWNLDEADGTGFDRRSNTYEILAGVSSKLWDGFVVRFGTGFVWNRSKLFTGVGNTTETQTGVPFELGIDYNFKTTQISFFAERGVEPSSSGEMTVRTAGDLTISHQINRATSIALTASFSRRESVSDELDTETDYATLTPTYSMTLARGWTAVIGAEYAHREDITSSASSKSVFVSLKWDVPRHRW